MKHVIGLLFALGVVLAIAPASTGSTLATAPPSRAAEPAPVASLEPAKTEALWRRLVASRARRAQAPADCRPLRGVFYAATDYLRLATKLAATASPCAQYYISIPPLVADKTKPRPNAASRVRALGPNFHAMAEIHFTTWSRWVQSTGSSWYTAGVTARERMAAAGYDVAKGDTWVVNELSTAVRRNTGNARTNIRELLRGLFEGTGIRTRGAVFVVGVGQRTSDTSLLQTNLQNWYSDAAFWTDMSTYVSDWGQEVYGDIRSHAVPGAPEETRRDYANDYLQHPLVLAGVGPATIETARSYLQTSYSPLANAAWERETGYGWTMVPAEQMGAYVSSQVHALRYFSATTGQPQDHWGFAWAPRNAAGVPAGEFAARSGLVLDRLAAAIRDSAETTDSADPGSAACGPPGQSLNCAFDVEGASLNEAWKSFRTWTQPVLGFATAPQTIPAGSVSGSDEPGARHQLGAGGDHAHHPGGDGHLELVHRHLLDEPDRPVVAHTRPHDRRGHADDRPVLLPGHEGRKSHADGGSRGCNERHAGPDGPPRADGDLRGHARRRPTCRLVARRSWRLRAPTATGTSSP